MYLRHEYSLQANEVSAFCFSSWRYAFDSGHCLLIQRICELAKNTSICFEGKEKKEKEKRKQKLGKKISKFFE